jgi:hypothetical protein
MPAASISQSATRPRPKARSIESTLIQQSSGRRVIYESVGIVQQGPYPDKELILLELPATDPFYSKLPVAVPKPCDESYTGSKDTCNHCEQPYSKKDLHRHAPSCIIFFSQHAVICDHCRKVFVKNGAFLLHEKQCTNSQQQHYAQSNLSYRSSKAPSAEPTASLPWGFNQLYNPSANTHPGSLS